MQTHELCTCMQRYDLQVLCKPPSSETVLCFVSLIPSVRKLQLYFRKLLCGRHKTRRRCREVRRFFLYFFCLYNKGSCCSILKCFMLQWFVLGGFWCGRTHGARSWVGDVTLVLDPAVVGTFFMGKWSVESSSNGRHGEHTHC